MTPRRELQRAAGSDGPAAAFAAAALGDGPPAARLPDAIRALVLHRGPGSSICPSDAARAVGGDSWRELMAPAREAAADLARAGSVDITQGGEPVDPDGPWRGPIRIRQRPSTR
ncbi:DUF3253 domain-containing protein [Mycobacterium sp. MYCO198283]|uniref:DUF3253 domain-containing protein n=1 Tax=Mycobacterium sp. MYCO198283 TaxID=2883505 RepID=UPI001E573ED7|nr:DUF3253 domain-containing protein [Mycobacterium sp. MYCO198283]MCG5433155.1 DUF3253 domain-containing protein [Mycobacterium sp. MYCO198283]